MEQIVTPHALWIPAGNNHAAFARLNFVGITDPWDAGNTIRTLKNRKAGT